MAKKEAQLSYQEIAAELDALVAWFQSEDVDLNEAISKYERGIDLVAQLEERIATAENKIEKLQQRFDGTGTVPGTA